MTRTIRTTWQRIVREERGFSLLELQVAMVIFFIIFGAILMFLSGATRTTRRDATRATSINTAQSQINRMVREFRGATSFSDWGPNFADFFIGSMEVRYQCDIADPTDATRRQCTRVSATGGAPLPASSTGEVIGSRLLNGTSANPVFTYTIPPDPPPDPDDDPVDPTDPPPPPQPDYVTVRFEIPSGGERKTLKYTHSIVLDSGLYLRNLDPAAAGTGAT